MNDFDKTKIKELIESLSFDTKEKELLNDIIKLLELKTFDSVNERVIYTSILLSLFTSREESEKKELSTTEESFRREKSFVETKKEIKSLREELFEQNYQLGLKHRKVKNELNTLKKYIFEITNKSFINDLKLEQEPSKFPIEIYLDTDKSPLITVIYQRLSDFLEDLELEIDIELEAIRGSWLKRFIARTKSIFSSEEFHQKLDEAEHGLKVNYITKQQSEIDKNQADGLANILESSGGIPNMALRIGSLLVLKITDDTGETSVISQTLTVDEMMFLERNPDLLKKPQAILDKLSSDLVPDDKDGK